MKRAKTAAIALLVGLTLAACGGTTTDTGEAGVSPEGEIQAREISWLLSRPVDGPTLKIIQDLAAEYAEGHDGFALNLITTPDRPSYVQKLQTLAAAGELPEFFDIDATPFAAQLAEQGTMVDVEELLTDIGVYDDFRAAALNYQRFDDGSLYMIPLEFQMEFFWYNSALFEEAGVDVPETLNDFPQMCQDLRASGVTPIALDGQDQWPLERYLAYMPFRLEGPDFVKSLKTGDAAMSSETGTAAAEWMAALGEAGCFDEGFSSTGYADAQGLFTSRQAAVYNMGTWELGNLATENLAEPVRSEISFFTLPIVENSATDANEFVVVSGIGMAVNARTFDPLVRDFVEYIVTNYPERYAATGAMSPTSNVEVTIPENATPLYEEALNTANDLGERLLMPWDTQLDPTTNTRLQQDLVTLVQGTTSPEDFVATVDQQIAANS